LLQTETLFAGDQLPLFIQNFGHKLIEGNLGTLKCLCTSLYVHNSDIFCNFTCVITCNLASLIQIYLVAHQQQIYFRYISRLTDLLDPIIDHFEAFLVAYVENKQNTVDFTIVVWSYRIVPRSPCRVPYLHPHASRLQFYSLLLVLDSDSRCMIRCELLIHILKQQRALPHVALPDY
jgi:hypothetical protein